MIRYSAFFTKADDGSRGIVIKDFVVCVFRYEFVVIHSSKHDPINKTYGFKKHMDVLFNNVWRWVRFDANPCSAVVLMKVA